MDVDLLKLLEAWPYEAGRVLVRRIEAEDGTERLQVRVELGILQMEMTGRPDGQRPGGFPSLLELHRDRLVRYTRESGSAAGFVLSTEECRALREEAVQYYHRYVALFALGDHEAVIRDTVRNLEVFDLCRDFAAAGPDRVLLEQFRPQVIMMRSRAGAEAAVAAGRPRDALLAIDQGLDEIRAVVDSGDDPEVFDRLGEVQLLRGMRDALVPRLPASQRVELEERLRAALDAENYELAAILRDELRLLGR